MPTCDGLLQRRSQSQNEQGVTKEEDPYKYVHAADEEYLVSICHSSCSFSDNSVVELLGIKLFYNLPA